MASLGIYDSGVGGISILNAIRAVHPRLAVTYLADQQIMPLGEKSREYIRDRVRSASQYLFDHDCPLVILACNTASVVSIRFLQETWIRPRAAGRYNILGINKPLMEVMSDRYAALKPKAGMLISTSATYDFGYYQNELENRGFYYVCAVSSTDLASAIEAGDRERVDAAVARAIGKLPVTPEEVEFVILACTHYPFALDQIRRFFSPQTVFIEPGPAVAEKLGDYLSRHAEFVLGEDRVRYMTTGRETDFSIQIQKLTGKSVTVEHVEI